MWCDKKNVKCEDEETDYSVSVCNTCKKNWINSQWWIELWFFVSREDYYSLEKYITFFKIKNQYI